MPTNEIPNEWIHTHQLSEFKTYLNRLSVIYSMLIEKRLNDELTRDEYMIYDMFDMIIPLVAALDEINSPTPYPSYIVEKLEKVKSYVDTTLSHFEKRSEQVGTQEPRDKDNA